MLNSSIPPSKHLRQLGDTHPLVSWLNVIQNLHKSDSPMPINTNAKPHKPLRRHDPRRVREPPKARTGHPIPSPLQKPMPSPSKFTTTTEKRRNPTCCQPLRSGVDIEIIANTTGLSISHSMIYNPVTQTSTGHNSLSTSDREHGPVGRK